MHMIQIILRIFFSFETVLRKLTQEKRILLIFIKLISFKNVYNSCQRTRKP